MNQWRADSSSTLRFRSENKSIFHAKRNEPEGLLHFTIHFTMESRNELQEGERRMGEKG